MPAVVLVAQRQQLRLGRRKRAARARSCGRSRAALRARDHEARVVARHGALSARSARAPEQSSLIDACPALVGLCAQRLDLRAEQRHVGLEGRHADRDRAPDLAARAARARDADPAQRRDDLGAARRPDGHSRARPRRARRAAIGTVPQKPLRKLCAPDARRRRQGAASRSPRPVRDAVHEQREPATARAGGSSCRSRTPRWRCPAGSDRRQRRLELHHELSGHGRRKLAEDAGGEPLPRESPGHAMAAGCGRPRSAASRSPPRRGDCGLLGGRRRSAADGDRRGPLPRPRQRPAAGRSAAARGWRRPACRRPSSRRTGSHRARPARGARGGRTTRSRSRRRCRSGSRGWRRSSTLTPELLRAPRWSSGAAAMSAGDAAGRTAGRAAGSSARRCPRSRRS